jgi:hypothetical protein
MEKKLITIEEQQYWDKIKNTSQIISYEELIYIDANFIDEFCTYLTNSGTDIYAFQKSSASYRTKIYNNWFLNLPPEKRQLDLF